MERHDWAGVLLALGGLALAIGLMIEAPSASATVCGPDRCVTATATDRSGIAAYKPHLMYGGVIAIIIALFNT